MSQDAELRCRCGEVRGRVRNATPKTVMRVVCYCDDCQAYVHHLGRADLLDAHGGTDIVQVAPASLSFDQGKERIRGLRLTPNGLYRWFASCCRTPVGNALGLGFPFVGIVARAFEGKAGAPDDVFGKPIGGAWGKYAVGIAPKGSTGLNLGLLGHGLRTVLGWKMSGQTWPHPFFDRTTRAPSTPLSTLSRAEREALRALCGPRPTRVAASGDILSSSMVADANGEAK